MDDFRAIYGQGICPLTVPCAKYDHVCDVCDKDTKRGKPLVIEFFDVSYTNHG